MFRYRTVGRYDDRADKVLQQLALELASLAWRSHDEVRDQRRQGETVATVFRRLRETLSEANIPFRTSKQSCGGSSTPLTFLGL